MKSIIDTPLTESLVNEIFRQQNNVSAILPDFAISNCLFIKDGSFPITEKFGQLFNVDFEPIKQELKVRGLQSSSK